MARVVQCSRWITLNLAEAAMVVIGPCPPGSVVEGIMIHVENANAGSTGGLDVAITSQRPEVTFAGVETDRFLTDGAVIFNAGEIGPRWYPMWHRMEGEDRYVAARVTGVGGAVECSLTVAVRPPWKGK